MNDSKKNDRQDGSKQTYDKSMGLVNVARLKNNPNSRYKLTTNNYVFELHKALLKECNDNLLDFNLLNASLDFESLTDVTSRTFKAIKVIDKRSLTFLNTSLIYIVMDVWWGSTGSRLRSQNRILCFPIILL